MISKSLIKDGDFVLTANNLFCLVLNNQLFKYHEKEGGIRKCAISLDVYEDNLNPIVLYEEGLRIDKIYRIKNIPKTRYLEDILNNKNGVNEEFFEVIASRPKLIKWSKVPMFTKVIAKNKKGEFINQYFICKNIINEEEVFVCSSIKPDSFTGYVLNEKDLKEYKECEIHPSETIKNEWIK